MKKSSTFVNLLSPIPEQKTNIKRSVTPIPTSYYKKLQNGHFKIYLKTVPEVGTNVKVSFMERTKTKFFVKLQTKTK